MVICYPDSTDWSCLSEQEFDSLDPELKARSEALAWSTLVRLTGQRLSICPVILRPCAARCSPGGYSEGFGYFGGSYAPYISGGNWYNACGCVSDCNCESSRAIRLVGEVSGPLTVSINGGQLSPSAYRIDNGNLLVRQDGGEWPLGQDINAPLGSNTPYIVDIGTGSVTFTRSGDTVTVSATAWQGGELNAIYDVPEWASPTATVYAPSVENTEAEINPVGMEGNPKGQLTVAQEESNGWTVFYVSPNEDDRPNLTEHETFAISYYPGMGPDSHLNYAAGILALEWYKACTNNGSCRLPQSVTQVTRQGVSFTLPTGAFEDGLSGIREVDAITGMYNPNRLKVPTRILSPDTNRGRQRTA